MLEWGTVASIILAFATLITVITAIPKIRAEASKISIDADASSGAIALQIAKDLRLDVDRLKADNIILRSESAKLREENLQLREYLETAKDEMKEQIAAKDKQIEELMNGVATLCTQVRQQGSEPWWNPKKRG